jgi:hypothetical protein
MVPVKQDTPEFGFVLSSLSAASGTRLFRVRLFLEFRRELQQLSTHVGVYRCSRQPPTSLRLFAEHL